MSGPENLRGIDYQVSCSLFLILNKFLNTGSEVIEIQIESLDEDGEDLAFRLQNGTTLQIQIKKLAEGYNWTPSSIRPVLSRFSKMDENTDFLFISDGSASRQLESLKRFLEGQGDLTPAERDSACGEGLSYPALLSLRGRVRIKTRYFPSSDESNPAQQLRAEINRTLLRSPFLIDRDAAEVTERLWRVVYESGRTALSFSREELIARFLVAGLRLEKNEWAAYPVTQNFYNHTEPIDNLVSALANGAIIMIFGMGGSGKTTLAAEAASMAALGGRKTCWLTMSEFLEPADINQALAQYCSIIGFAEAAENLRLAEPYRSSAIIANTFHRFSITAVFDRLEAASPRLTGFISDILASLPPSKRPGSIIVTSRHLPSWWVTPRPTPSGAGDVFGGGSSLSLGRALASQGPALP
jgi:hypothetical protein